jgi:hypothetical protein
MCGGLLACFHVLLGNCLGYNLFVWIILQMVAEIYYYLYIFRKSVIVERRSVIKPTVAKNITNEDGTKDDHIKFVVSLNINELENIYTLEEKKYFDQVLTIFDEKWNGTSLDEKTIYQTINYYKSGISENVPMEYFQTLNFYLR